MFKKELYKSRDGKENYLIRYVICRLPFLQIYIHNFLGPDEDQELHDHPYDCFKCVLMGGYVEELPHSFVQRKPGHMGILKGEDLHRIASVLPNTWTLFVGGRRRREWGFMTDGGWVRYDEHLARKLGERPDNG